MATSSALPRLWSRAVAKDAAAPAAYALGALLLAGEAAVHVQRFASEFHDVRWIGPLFLANAAAVVVTIAGLTQPRTRRLAALAGVVISAVALGSLIVSYGHGLFGWQEAGFQTPVALAMITEAGAVILLAIAVTLDPEAVRPATAARSPSSARTTASTQRLDSIDRGPHPSSDARRTGEAHAGAVDGCENCLAAGAGRVRRPDECERKASV